MNGSPDPGSPLTGGLFGNFTAWLKARSSGLLELSEVLTCEAGGRQVHSYKSIRVLVVDDEPVNRMLVSALLASRGIAPVLAADGAEAVALACELHFDLILMDLQMPILDGFAATSAIRRFEDNSSRSAVPVVAYSSATPGADVLAHHGLNGSLAKPCDEHDLEDCLVQWCPTYHAAPSAREAAYDMGSWQSMGRATGTGSASRR